MRIALIRPPFVFPKTQKRGNFGTPPLGIAYLASVLKAQGLDVYCIDAFGEKIYQLGEVPGSDLILSGLNKFQIVESISPDTDIIGVSCMFSNEWIYTREIVNEIHARFPQAKIILGGEHATADPEQCFRDCPSVVAVANGEGEDTIVELVSALRGHAPLSTVAGISWLGSDGVLIKNKSRSRIKELDSIPWPDWSTIPIQNYLDSKCSFGRQGRRAMPMLASRGCPYQCTFCSNPLMWGTKWNVRSVDDVIAEIKSYVRLYQMEHFDFMDLTAIIREDWIVEFCEKLIALNLNLTWALPTGTRSEALNERTLSYLLKSGCLKIHYAPESGSPATLKRIKKRIDIRKMSKSIRNAAKIGLICRANFIVGMPGDTLTDVLKTYWFSLKLAFYGMHDIAVFGFSPYPGSEMHAALVQEGRINKSNDVFVRKISKNVSNAPSSSVSWTDNFSSFEIRLHIWMMSLLFYFIQFSLRPYRIFPTVQRIYRNETLTTFEIVVANFMSQTKKRYGFLQLNQQVPRTSDLE